MTKRAFNTDIQEENDSIKGPFRAPAQMLAEQEYGGHLSIHDEDQAQVLGFSGAPIEGPTHFSQFDPLLHAIWGDRWYESGCISCHFKNVVVEGEEVQAFVARPQGDARITKVWAVKRTGEPVLEGTASMGPDHPETRLDELMASRPTPDNLVLLEGVKIGDKSATSDIVTMAFDQHLGNSYPFTLAQKLEKITEKCRWYKAEEVKDSPWRKPVLPTEMISPLVGYTSSGLRGPKGPSIGLFADLEVRMIKGPLFAGEKYALQREVVGLGESKRTESMWIKTYIKAPDTGELLATTLLNSATLKESYEHYEDEAKRLRKLI
ncbi:hypothetical protein OAL10_00885 [Gammaproteobacteria bacterium]|nr:hypothetical protein [Gammaproteobacteria bacterium]